MPKIEFSIKTETRPSHKKCLIKAREFLLAAQDSRTRENWNAVGLNAVHAAISASDAITIYQIGKRCTSEKHSDAVKLFLFAFPGNSEAKKQSNHLSRLIAKKNIVEYESRLFQQREAIESLKHSERFLNWVIKNIK